TSLLAVVARCWERRTGLYATRQIRMMAKRIGDVLYRTACIAAALWATFVLVAAPVLAQPDCTIWTPIAAAGAVVATPEATARRGCANIGKISGKGSDILTSRSSNLTQTRRHPIDAGKGST